MSEELISPSSPHEPAPGAAPLAAESASPIVVPAPVPPLDPVAIEPPLEASVAAPVKVVESGSPSIAPPRVGRQPRTRYVLLIRLIVWIAFAAAGLAALDAGIVLRRDFWKATTGQLRYPGDIENFWTLGDSVLAQAKIVHDRDDPKSHHISWPQFFRGYVATYDAAKNAHPDGAYQNDYPPLRLLAAGLWMKSVRRAYPNAAQWTEQVDRFGNSVTEPLLNFNTGAEILGALAAFLLVFRIVSQQRREPKRSIWTRSLGARPPPLLDRPSINNQWLLPHGVLAAVVALLVLGFYAHASYRIGYWPDWPEKSNIPGATDLLALLAIFIALIASIQSMSVPYMAWFAGLVAALLAWFNPALLLDAHAWPQWDCWIIPTYLIAALFISLDWGYAAGAIIAVGCMIKGQVLIVSPILLLWPLLAGRFRTAVCFAIGFAVTATVLVSPWLVPTGNWQWVILFAAIAAVVPIKTFFVPRLYRVRLPARTFTQRTRRSIGRVWQLLLHDPRPRISLIMAVVLFITLLFNWRGRPGDPNPTAAQRYLQTLFTWWGRGIIAIVIACVPWLLRRRWSRVFAVAACVAAAVWLGFYRNPGGSDAWYGVGFKYGADRFQTIAMDHVCNLPDLLRREHQLDPASEIDISLPWESSPGTVSLRKIELGIYGFSLLIISVGAALNERRRDTRLLVALAAPWVVMFAVMPQMHERYLMYGAVIGSVCVATGLGDTLAVLILTALAASQILLESFNAGASPMLVQFRAYLSASEPGFGWITVVCAAMFIVNSVAPRLRTVWPQSDNLQDSPPAPAS